MKIMISIFILIIGMLVVIPLALSSQEEKPYVGSPGLERLKQLVGQWEGTMDMGKGPQKITASYRISSGGSAIIETVFEGSPHEMVTIYHDDSNRRLGLTHYCMLKNQPKMVLKRIEKNSFVFDLAKDADIDVAKERHMHAVTISMEGRDRMSQLWTEYRDGAPKKSEAITYRRIQ